jgi:hypothetical protein
MNGFRALSGFAIPPLAERKNSHGPYPFHESRAIIKCVAVVPAAAAATVRPVLGEVLLTGCRCLFRLCFSFSLAFPAVLLVLATEESVYAITEALKILDETLSVVTPIYFSHDGRRR